MMNSKAQWLQLLFLVFNTICLFLWCAILDIGIWILKDSSGFLYLTGLDKIHCIMELNNKSYFLIIGLIMIVTGSINFVISFIQYHGGLKEWCSLTVLYALLLIGVLGLEFSTGIYFAGESERARSFLKTTLKESLAVYNYNDSNATFNQAWYMMMDYFGCCGANNFSDFEDNNIPYHCCDRNAKLVLECVENPSLNKELLYQMGCGDALINFKFIYITTGIVIVQVFGIILAICLFFAFQKKCPIQINIGVAKNEV